MINILVYAQKNDLSERIRDALSLCGYGSVFASDFEEAHRLAADGEVQLVIADYAGRGCELCSTLRDEQNRIPALILSEENSGQERRRIFRSGADGFIVVPFDTEELAMRVRNLLWRCSIEDDASVRFGDCTLYAGSLRVVCGEQTVELRRMEFLLLQKLISYPGRIFTRGQLMDDLWGMDSDSAPRTVDTHIKQLRKKLKNIDSIKIQTVRGLGYRIAKPKSKG